MTKERNPHNNEDSQADSGLHGWIPHTGGDCLAREFDACGECRLEIARLKAEVERLQDDLARKLYALYKLHQWAIKYPIDVFTEPDFKKAEEVLKLHGIAIGSITESAVRHVISQVMRIIGASMKQEGETE